MCIETNSSNAPVVSNLPKKAENATTKKIWNSAAYSRQPSEKSVTCASMNRTLVKCVSAI